MPTSRLIYLDACTFLYYVNDDEEKAPIVQAVLEEGDETGTQLFTSELSIVEVAFAAVEQIKAQLSDEQEEKINSLWVPGSPVSMVEYYGLIGEDAKQLMRSAITNSWSLKPLDAIHLATARRWSVEAFFTYDTGLPKYAEAMGFRIEEPSPLQEKLDLK